MKLKKSLIVLCFLAAVRSVPLNEVKKYSQSLTFRDVSDTNEFPPFKLYGDPIVKDDEIILDDELNYRLPNDSRPLRYDLWLKTDVHQNLFDFTGRVKIHITIIESTQRITLHARQLTIDNIDILNRDGSLVQSNLNHEYDDVLEFLIISLPVEFMENDQIILDISYHGILREDGSGFYRASYRNVDGEAVWFATTQFEMTDARHAMPCYDEPGIRAVTGLEIQHGNSLNAISNMPISTRDPISGTEYVTSIFQDTPPMQSYLLAFIISDYKFISNNDTSVEQRIFAVPQRIDRGDGDFAVQVVGPILRQLEEHFQLQYPLPKMDHAGITDYIWGAMENFGLITYQDTGLLFVNGSDPISKQKNIIELITHEYTHQFFGNIVSPKWWAYNWLNEAFATLFANFIPSLIYPEEDYMQRFEDGALVSAFNADSNPNAQSLNFYVQTPTDIRNKFSGIAYEKGGSVLRMMQEALTVATFAKGLNYYLNEMYFSSASPQDLHRGLQKAYDEDLPGNGVNLDAVMTTWEEQAGFPVVSVRKLSDSFFLTQQRFNGGNEIYSIPLSYTMKSEANFERRTPTLWFTSPSLALVSSEDWIIVNIKNTGYFKVSYDKSIWSAISSDLQKNHQIISAYHRAQLFKDLRTSLIEETFEGIYGLEHMKYLGNETLFSVWNQAFGVEAVFSSHLFGTSVMTKYNEFIQRLIKPHINRLTFENEPSDAELRNLIKTFSCKSLQQECLDYEHQRLTNFLEDGLGSYSLCDGLRIASETVHTDLINMLLSASGNRNTYVDNLGCSLNQNLIRNYLQVLLNETNNLNANERSRGISQTLGKSAVALETTVEFVRQNYIEIERM